MNNYNVNISLSDVACNSEIVISVGHSQLIKWIEDLTNTSENYLKAEQVRKEIKYLKSLDNTKENKKKIKDKYDELYGAKRYNLSLRLGRNMLWCPSSSVFIG